MKLLLLGKLKKRFAFSPETFLLQHLFLLLMGTIGIFVIGFLFFFYTAFYRVVNSADPLISEQIIAQEEIINLRQYEKILEFHKEKISTGEYWASFSPEQRNPFTNP